MASSPKKRANKGHMEMSVIYDYLTNGKYPQNYNAADKRTVRKRAKDFTLKDSELYHITVETDENGDGVRVIERFVLRTQAQRWRAIAEAHIDAQGNHRGMEKTSNQLSEKFYWVGISVMVREYIRRCGQCQAARGSFSLSAQDTLTASTPLSTPRQSPLLTVLKVEEEEPSPNPAFEMESGQAESPEPEDTEDIVMEDIPVRKSVTYFWEKVEIQVLGPFQVTAKKELYVVMFVDVFSLWPEAVVTDYISPTVVTQFLLKLVARYGLMQSLLYRKNEKLEKEDVLPMVSLLRSHGLPVSFEMGKYQELDDIWSAMSKTVNRFVKDQPTDWFQCLDFCLLPHRISRSQQAEYTPAFLTHGREPVLPAEMSHRRDLITDPQLTEDQMNFTIHKLYDIYNSYRDDIPPSHLYHGTVSYNIWKKSQQTKKQEEIVYEEEPNNELFTPPQEISRSGVSSSTMQTRSQSGSDVYENSPSTVYSFRHKRRYPECGVNETSSPMKMGDVNMKREHSLESLSIDSEVEKTELGSYLKDSGEKVDLDFYYQAIYQYKKNGSYPPKSTDYFKRLIRKTTNKHILKDDLLYYLGEKQERIIVMTQKERFDRLRQAHVAKDGSHIPKNKMIDRLSSCFWKGLTLDSEAFVQACPYCNLGSQRTHIYADEVGETVPVVKEEKNPEMDEAVRIAEENYTALYNMLKSGKKTDSKKNRDPIVQIRSKFHLSKKCLYYKEKGMKTARLVPKTQKEKETYIKAAHVQSVGRHYSPWVTLKHLKEKYVWTNMVQDAEEFVEKCAVCTSVNRTQVRKKVMKTRRSVYQKLFDTEEINDKYLGLSESQIQDMADDGEVKSSVEADKTTVSVDETETTEQTETAANILNLVGLESRVAPDSERSSKTDVIENKSNGDNVESADSIPSNAQMDSDCFNVTEDCEENVQNVFEQDSEHPGPADTSQLESVVSPPGSTVKTEKIVPMETSESQSSHSNEGILDPQTGNIIRTVSVDDPIVAAAVQTIMPIENEMILSVADSVDQSTTRYEVCHQPSDDIVEKTECIDDDQSEKNVIVKSGNDTTMETDPRKAKIERIIRLSGKKKKRKNTFKCEYCDAYISGKIKFTAHVYRHTGQKAFQCEECGKKFTCAKTKRIHMRKHTGNLPFLCNLCGKGFPRSGGLRSHLRTHEKGGGIAVKCSICDRIFASSNRLQRHVQFKHPDNPTVHKCNDCNKVFSAQRSLKRHRESHHLNLKNHICPYCGKTFFRKEYLTSHLSQHTGEPRNKRHYNPRPKLITRTVVKTSTEDIEEPVSHPVQEDQAEFEVQTDFVPLTVSAEASTTDVEPQTEVIVTTPESAQQILASSDGEQQVQMYQYYTSEEGVKEEDVIHVLSGGGTLLFSTPGVQYEVECESSSEQIDAALSAINLLAQASATHTM